MHTTPDTATATMETSELTAIRTQIELERLRLELTMIRVQTKALETLERLMDDPEPTGNEKQDRFEATKRNRQRLAANQTLIHCRTAEREKRLAKDKHQRLEPNRASDGQQASEKNMPDPPSPLRGRRWSCADSAQDRMRGRPEPSDHLSPPSLGAMVGAEGAGHADNGSPVKPLPPSPLEGEGDDRSQIDRRMRGRSESSDRSNNTKPKRSRYKVRKPKHPRRSRKRKRGR
ncbi:MAG: hypothetical protein ACIAQF_13490 [Phycisphaerales bacterium JB065]